MIFLSNKIRVEIVLPLYYNDKTQIEPGKFLETRRELTANFGGCTAMPPTEIAFEFNSIMKRVILCALLMHLHFPTVIYFPRISYLSDKTSCILSKTSFVCDSILIWR